MADIRTIIEASESIPTMEGGGVHLRRAFGMHHPERYDPFLLLDDFRSDIPEQYVAGFPWHPHRGIETITYVLRGDVEHGDSLGNRGVISGGDVQWMTAGSGIVHHEMPEGDENGSMHGFQLWLNLPRKDKMCDPTYRGIGKEDIPELVRDDGVQVKIICGELDGITGPVTGIATEATYMEIAVPANCSYNHPVTEEFTVIAYIIGGRAAFYQGGEYYGNRNLLLFGDGQEIAIITAEQGVRLLLMTGRPLKEPIAWQGPIVMNSEEELKQAFEQYQQGTFLRHK